jgi:hypothetical protein
VQALRTALASCCENGLCSVRQAAGTGMNALLLILLFASWLTAALPASA